MYLDAKLPSPDVVASVKECAIKSQAGVLPPTSVLAVAAPQQGNLIKMLFVGIQQLIQALICLGRNIRIAVITPSRCDRNASLFAKETGHMCHHLPASRPEIPLMRHFHTNGIAGTVLSPHCFHASHGWWLDCGGCCCCCFSATGLLIKASLGDSGWVEE